MVGIIVDRAVTDQEKSTSKLFTWDIVISILCEPDKYITLTFCHRDNELPHSVVGFTLVSTDTRNQLWPPYVGELDRFNQHGTSTHTRTTIDVSIQAVVPPLTSNLYIYTYIYIL